MNRSRLPQENSTPIGAANLKFATWSQQFDVTEISKVAELQSSAA